MTASSINPDFIRQHPAQAVLTILGLSGVALVFLPFFNHEVPLDHFLKGLPNASEPEFWWLPPCIILPFVIFAGYLRWLLTGHLSSWENKLGYVLAVIGALGVPVMVIYDWRWPPATDDWVDLFVFLVPFAAGAWFIAQSQRGGMSPVPTALVAMQVVYLVFALFWLTALAVEVALDDAGSGGYLALVTVLVYTAQAVLLMHGRPRKLLKLLPLVLIWMSSVGLLAWFWE